MNVLKTLIAGWLLGALLLVGLGAYGARLEKGSRQVVKSTSRQDVTSLTAPVLASTTRRLDHSSTARVLIPVAGIAADQLRDTFDEARGGGSRVHRAMDILAPIGTPVVASVDGTIRKLFFSKAGGITIYQYDVDERQIFYYAHLDRYADGLAEGQFVKQGAVIGYVGITGNAPKGTPHLHFSIENLPPTKEWWKGEPVNPYPILVAR